MLTSIRHNDTELIGKIGFILYEDKIELLSADNSVYEFFSVAKPNTVLLFDALGLDKHIKEIKNITEDQTSFNLILKNKMGYFDAVFNVESVSSDGICANALLFKSRETDTVFTAAALSADSIFRYGLKEKKLYLYTNFEGEFKFLGRFENFEKYFFEHNIVCKGSEESFHRLCMDIYDGKQDIEYEINLSDGNSSSFRTYIIRAKTVHSENEDTVMGLIVNNSKTVPLKKKDQDLEFERSITNLAFDLIDSSASSDDAINLLIRKIAQYISTDKVSVFEIHSRNAYSLVKTYGCQRDEGDFVTEKISPKSKVFETSEHDWNIMRSGFDVGKYIAAEDLDSCKNLPEILRRCSEGSKSAIFYSIYDSGNFCGVLCCESFTNRNWDENSINTVKALSRVISSFLLKIRAYQRANVTIEKLTNFDWLTGLPEINRFKRAAAEVLKMEAAPEDLSLIYYNINNFKYLNEQYGNKKGDVILRDFGLAIAPNSNETVLSCRIFSDQFVSLVRCPPERLPDIMTTVTDSFINMQRAKGHDLKITFSVGFYTFKDFDTDIGTALDNVTLACKSNKNLAETSYAFYEDKMTSGVKTEIEMLNNAMKALINKEFVVYYQPKIALETSRLVGGEALVRWKKPDGTMIPPDEFIPCLEKNGFITVLDFYVYEEVCRFIKNRIDNYLPVVPISVNVSMLHLKEESFLQRIEGLVRGYGIPPHLLEFELTESVFLENQQAALDIMAKMREMGFMVSIDDFGSGFSSLNMLKSLPVDILKIDKEFFSNHTLLNNDQIILSSIINMASRLHISVICEGVETPDQIKFLRETECDMVQGYFYSKPVSEDVFMDYNMNPDFTGKEK